MSQGFREMLREEFGWGRGTALAVGGKRWEAEETRTPALTFPSGVILEQILWFHWTSGLILFKFFPQIAFSFFILLELLKASTETEKLVKQI